MDYNQSHVVTFDEYLQVPHIKTMDKQTIEVIKKQKIKEREKRNKRHVVNSHRALIE